MHLYNTRTESVDPFPLSAKPVTIYVCGITPYDTTHLGHAFTYVVNDTLIRYLEYLGHVVRYTQNVTDIDDDILRKAKEVGEDWRTLGNRWTAHFIQDLATLQVRPPDFFPRATDVIPQIIADIEGLLRVGVAYVSNGNVYYQVDKWADFGKLSGVPPAEQLPLANERGNHPDDPHKRHPLDFVLWQAQAEGEPAWASPWGMGRPGWHIECSAMATHFLGETIDLHSGGSDLIFPHHECEVAQAEPLTGKRPYVRCWLHVAMVQYQGEKMSKSLGNLVMVRDLLQHFSANTILLYLGQHHYRTALDFAEESLHAAAKQAEALQAAAQVKSGRGQVLDVTALQYEFTEALGNDLDTPCALYILTTIAERIRAASAAGWHIDNAQETLHTLGQVLGLQLDQDAPDRRVAGGWLRHLAKFQ